MNTLNQPVVRYHKSQAHLIAFKVFHFVLVVMKIVAIFGVIGGGLAWIASAVFNLAIANIGYVVFGALFIMLCSPSQHTYNRTSVIVYG